MKNINKLLLITAAASLCWAADATAASGEHKQSEFRQGMRLAFLYDQDIGGGYSSSWWGRVVKINGSWVDVYIETNEKITSTGVISFDCKAEGDIAVIDYGNEWGDADQKILYIIKPKDRSAWQAGTLPYEKSPAAPYELYQAVARRYCRVI